MTSACQHCGHAFEPRRKSQRFCSAKCRRTAFNEAGMEVSGLRQTKRGWSLTIRCQHQPMVNIADLVRVSRV